MAQEGQGEAVRPIVRGGGGWVSALGTIPSSPAHGVWFVLEQSGLRLVQGCAFHGHLFPVPRDYINNRAINWVAINPVGVHA